MHTNKSGLVPTPIVNKNGVSTIVYRKPSSNIESSRKAPAPQVKPASTHSGTIHLDSVDRLAHSDDIEADRRTLSEQLEYIEPSYSDQTVGLLANLIRSGVPTRVLDSYIEETQIMESSYKLSNAEQLAKDEEELAKMLALMFPVRDLLTHHEHENDMGTVHKKYFFNAVTTSVGIIYDTDTGNLMPMETEDHFDRYASTLQYMLRLSTEDYNDYGTTTEKGLRAKEEWISLITEVRSPEESQKLADYYSMRGTDAEGARAYLAAEQTNAVRNGWL